MTASTARRSMARLARSLGERLLLAMVPSCSCGLLHVPEIAGLPPLPPSFAALPPHPPVVGARDAVDQRRIARGGTAGVELDPHASVGLRSDVRHDVDAVACAADLARTAILGGDSHPLVRKRADGCGP